MHFELWETSTGNAIGEYDTEVAALAVVRDTDLEGGHTAARTFALVSIDSRGRAKTVAQGDELAERALASARLDSTALPV